VAGVDGKSLAVVLEAHRSGLGVRHHLGAQGFNLLGGVRVGEFGTEGFYGQPLS
jgi:hypothetical protein